MCLIVRVIVHAKDEEEAFKKGKEALNEIAEGTASGVYITYDSKELLDEWKVDPNNLPPVVLASTFKGKQLIEEGWQFMVDIFMHALERIKLAVQYLTPEQIMEEDSQENLSEEIKARIRPSGIREDFREVGGVGENIFKLLYFESRPITSRRALERALYPGEGLKAYLIPAAIPC
jgi:hypothetical protein